MEPKTTTPEYGLHLRVAGWVPDDWTERFEGISVRHAPDGSTVLCGEAKDQSALFGILHALEGRGVKLVAAFVESLALLLALLAAPADAATFTLEQSLSRALSANPSVVRARAEAEAARAEKKVALSAVLPRLGADATAVQNDREVAEFGTVFQPRRDAAVRLTLAQPLYLGGRAAAGIRQAALAADAAEAAVSAAEDAALFRTAADHLALVAADAMVAVEKQNVELASSRRTQAQRLLDAGESTRVDVLRAEAAQKAAERQLATAEQQRKDSESRLRLDLALDVEILAAPPALALPPVPAAEELTLRALAAHPELRRAADAVAAARLEIRRERGALLPSVVLGATVARQRSDFPTDRSASVAVSLHVPIFDGGETTARVAAAREREFAASSAEVEARQSVREEIGRAVTALATSRKTSELAREQLAAAEAEYEQVAALYRAQEVTSLDIDAAEATLAEARRAVVLEGLDTELAELRVWLAAGLLKTTLLHKES